MEELFLKATSAGGMQFTGVSLVVVFATNAMSFLHLFPFICVSFLFFDASVCNPETFLPKSIGNSFKSRILVFRVVCSKYFIYIGTFRIISLVTHIDCQLIPVKKYVFEKKNIYFV